MLQNLIAPVTGLLDKFIEDKDQKNALAHEISTMADRHAQELAKGQLAVNAVEAAHKSLFVAGWRPFCGPHRWDHALLPAPLAAPLRKHLRPRAAQSWPAPSRACPAPQSKRPQVSRRPL